MSQLKLDEAAFEDLFERVVAPALAPYEAERRRLIRGFWRRLAAGVGLGVLAAVVVGVLSRDFDGLGDIVVMVAGLFAGLAYMPLHRFEKRCKATALTALAQSLELTYACDGFDPPRIEIMRDLGLLAPWEDADYEDLWTGHLHGADFALYEARQTRGSGKSRKTTFAGQIIRVAFPKSFLGVTVVNRDRAFRIRDKRLQPIGLESGEFERIFDVYGTDQVEGRYLVHPVFMERLVGVEAATKGRNLRCAFVEGDLIIAIEGSNLFEVVEVFKPVPQKERAREGIDQLQQLVGLIDAVMAPPARVYGSAPSSAST